MAPTQTGLMTTPKGKIAKAVAGGFLVVAGIIEVLEGNQAIGFPLIVAGAADLGFTVSLN